MAHHIVPACVAEMRRCALLLGALLCLQAPGLASADGLNEWSGSPAAAGEVWFVPQGVIELGSGPPQAYYLQTQFGLAKDLDLIATPTFTAAEGELEMPILDIYARYALTGNLMVGLGASTRLVFDQMPGVILGLFQTFESSDEVWKLTWNAVAWMPPEAPDTTYSYGVVALTRRQDDMLSFYAELDAGIGIGTGGDRNVWLGGGVQLDFGDIDVLNFGVLVPVQPLVGEDAPLMLSAWYGHGFNVDLTK